MEKVRRRTDTATTVRRGSDGEGGAGGTGFFYGNILVGHTVCRRGRRSQRRSGSVEEEDDEEQGRSDQ